MSRECLGTQGGCGFTVLAKNNQSCTEEKKKN